ncbi:D-arabinose 1-dehydrogenase, Zn-dependent alcohol dehydrogenase family [Hymenobacter daecheongensis DSM 21074]|uniref:D-arabinose 1-dehydrogenase, Zn-dependent alcohol dehydrogenase family n=1 Tax=Hymenobacter daecheongensis DSM 21074 TaxID=1121955 RepID=A0A1M6MFS4_9BACT|nr:zinc-binding dehydrogenase [Hymenobacter daecheongensis]SHJ82213.1 D-arabinose 1-dehydrogenase, Zn-dependent alcohol dehydrogenase family [Hymenobacter daecheongensis DSM 21074]
MQALQLNGINQPLVLTEVPTPAPGPGEVLVRLRAAALNHRDVWIQKGQYAGLKFPCILGSDGAGVVAALGEGVAADLLGQAVLINPGQNWGDNPHAQAKSFTILGLPHQGTFAEYVAVPAEKVHALPTHLGFEQAAALPLGGLTAYRAVFTRAGLRAGERVLITGVGGGVAILALQMAVAAGAEVWVTSGSPEKITRAVALGARGGVSYKDENWPADLVRQAGGAFDVLVDSAAGPGFGALLDAAAPGGRIMFYGGTLGAISQLPPAKIFWKQLSILGSTMGTDDDFAAMVRFVAEHKLVPMVDQVFGLAEGEQAMRRMDEGHQFGKIVLRIPE